MNDTMALRRQRHSRTTTEPRCAGERRQNHRRIGFDAVLGDLAAFGFDAEWTSLRASDVGAPHERERLFVFAWTVVPDTTRQRRNQGTGLRADDSGEVGRLFACDSTSDLGFRWSDYAPSIERWATITGRRPDRPVVKGPAGGLVPSARFVEWMMGLPDGWVTDVQGISTEQEITLLGNGVVPLQAEAAIRELLSNLTHEAAVRITVTVVAAPLAESSTASGGSTGRPFACVVHP